LSNLDFPVENCECSNLPLTGSRVPPGWGSSKQNTGVTKIGSVPAGWGSSQQNTGVTKIGSVPPGWGSSKQNTGVTKIGSVPPGWGSSQQNTRVTKIGSASKMSSRGGGGGVAYYLIVRGNIIIYVCFCGNHLYLFVYLQSKGPKNVQTCLSFPFVVFLYTLHYISVGARGSALG